MTVQLEGRERELIARLSGEIDHHTCRPMREELDRLLYLHRPRTLIIDLRAVSFMDSSGLGLILGRFSKASEIGTECILRNPNEHVTKILDVAGIGRLMRIERSSK